MTAKPNRLAEYWERQLDKLDARELRHAKRLPTWRTRARRRQLTKVVAVADVAFIVAAATFKLSPEWVFFVLWMGGAIVGGVGFFLLRILTGRMSGSFSRLLDEREREWRHRITFIGYQALVYLMIIAMFYSIALANQPDGSWRGVIMMSALLVTGSTVPSMVLGWSLPDDDPEDFEEGMGNE